MKKVFGFEKATLSENIFGPLRNFWERVSGSWFPFPDFG
jgi:hypothetical protein